MLEVISPYGKVVADELRAVYGVDGVEGLLDALLPHVEARYGLKIDSIDAVHVAYGLALALRSGGRRYVYKLTSTRIHSALADLFPWLDRLRGAGVPVPAVHRTREGGWFTAPLAGSDYDVAYLMDRADGAPAGRWSEEHAAGYAGLLAAFHTLGADHEPRVLGTRAFFAEKWADAGTIAAPLLASPAADKGAVERALALIGRTEVPPLPRTHVHGDARLCHVFFTGARVTGLIDCDQGTWGDRLLDLAYGAVSHPDPALGAWLGAEEVVRLVRRYDRLVGLTGAERRFLPAALVFAALEQLAETASFLGSDRANVGAADVKRATRLLDRIASRFVHTA